MKNNGLLFALLGAGALFVSAKGNAATSSGWKVPPHGMKYAKLFEKYEKRFKLPKNLVAVMAGIESSYRADAVGGVGEVGLMQLYKKYHPEKATVAISGNLKPDFTDPEQNIEYAAAYLRRLNNSIGNWEDTIRAYNWGIGNVRKWQKANRPAGKVPLVTQKYLTKISPAVNLKNPSKW
jgi:soluble lytic murein transglycosylase-like protein